MPYITKSSPNSLHGSTNYYNSKGSHECAILVQGVTDAPQTKMWKKGKKVIDSSPNEIRPGTVIATFDDTRKYPVIGNHAAIYISHDKEGIHVVDQWKDQGKALIRIIRSKKSAHRDVKWVYHNSDHITGTFERRNILTVINLHNSQRKDIITGHKFF